MRVVFAMRTLVMAVMLVGCGSPKHTPQPVTSQAPEPIAVVDAPDAPADPADPNGPAAAVPIPSELERPPLELVDTTITDDEVKAITGWPAAKRSKGGGAEVWVVLHSNDNELLELAIVRDNQGIHAAYPLGKAQRIQTELTYDGDAYPSRDRTGDYEGPILFAARITTPGRETPDQLVVFADGSTLRVARRPLGAAAWTPALAIAFKKGTTFRGIGTTDPH